MEKNKAKPLFKRRDRSHKACSFPGFQNLGFPLWLDSFVHGRFSFPLKKLDGPTYSSEQKPENTCEPADPPREKWTPAKCNHSLLV